jgi:hypothetical protein
MPFEDGEIERVVGKGKLLLYPMIIKVQTFVKNVGELKKDRRKGWRMIDHIYAEFWRVAVAEPGPELLL